MTDHGETLRVTSDNLLDNLDALMALEEEKRTLDADDPRVVELSRRVEELAKLVLQDTMNERRITVERQRAAALGAPIAETTIDDTPPTIPAILEAWRRAERELAGTPPGTPEAEVAEQRVERLREAYRRAHDERAGG